MKRLLLIIVLLLIPVVSAVNFNTTSFNNSLSTEYIVLNNSVNVTRYLTIPSGTNVLNGRLTLKYPIINPISDYYWKLDDVSGDAVESISGIYNGTLFNMTRGKHGIVNNSYFFNQTLHGEVNLTDLGGDSVSNITSISLWFNKSAGGNDRLISIGKDSPFSTNFEISLDDTNGVILYTKLQNGTEQQVESGHHVSNHTWINVVGVYNSNSGVLRMYINGVLNGTKNFGSGATIQQTPSDIRLGNAFGGIDRNYHGYMDDVRYWKSNLSQETITGIYNNGNPAQASTKSENLSLKFGSTLVFNATNIANITSSSVNETITTSDLSSSINTYLSTCTFVNGNCSVPFEFSTTAQDTFIEYSSLVFDNVGFIENTQTFNDNTIELSDETFSINITYDSGRFTSVVGTLIYNNTRYTGTSVSSGDNYIYTKSISVDNIITATSLSFLWEFSAVNSSGGIELYNSTTNTQSVNPLNIDDCSTYTELVLNMSLHDEEEQTLLTLGTTINGSIESEVVLQSEVNPSNTLTFSQNYTNINPAQVCVSSGTLNSSVYRLDSTIKYSSTNRQVEFYHIQNATMNNNSFPQNIKLFDLLTDDAQTYIITFKDNSFNPVSEALINIQRKYINEGQFKTIEIPLTNIDGQAIASLVNNDIIYNIIVSKNGVTLGTFENIRAICQNPTLTDCVINLNKFGTNPEPFDFNKDKNINYRFSYDSDNRLASVTFSTISGITGTFSFNVTELKGNLSGNNICSKTLSTSAGSLNCDIPNSIDNSTIHLELLFNDEFVSQSFVSIRLSPEDTFGQGRVFVILIMLLSIPFMALGNVMITLILLVVTMIFLVSVNVLSPSTSGQIIGGASFIIWFIVAISIMVWKLSRKE